MAGKRLLVNNYQGPGLYEHYKGGLYDVGPLARHSEWTDLKEHGEEYMFVSYREYGGDQHWIRPLNMFNEQVTTEGGLVPRFARLRDE